MIDLSNRHESTQHTAQFFAYDRLPEHLRNVARHCHDLAEHMIRTLPDGPELTIGLRKLLEAKDAFVRHALTSANRQGGA